ncbi:unnamed protein product [Nesidiocoris tenuis]|uniref:NADH dehydrogenase [ubiquinone] 1 alpha subcomplex subunit 2 n=1 Tax=Nesidiocoris tenuis TaxID=355587 RepID=A0A6H5FZA7_9HEMI|nr:unnamed protein product [Nesidiocoris tenuis]
MASAIKVGRAVKELRVHLCQKGTSSKGVRDFVESLYVPLKKANPQLPILIRECKGVSPRLWARYDNPLRYNISGH